MTFTITQNDTAPPIESSLRDGSVPIDFSNVSNVRFHMENKYHELVIDDDLAGRVSKVDPNTATVEYVWKDDGSDTDTVGVYWAEWEVVYDDGTRETFPTGDKIEVQIVEAIE